MDAKISVPSVDLDQTSGPKPLAAAAALAQGTTRINLRQLFLLRNIAVVGQALTVLVVDRGLGIRLPLTALGFVIAALALFNVFTGWRLRNPRPVGELELLGQIATDVTALTALLYFTGGATNPFVGLYLLPLTVAAASLPALHTWMLALFAVAGYSLLVFVHVPLDTGGLRGGLPELLVSGMWVNYVISSGLIAYFVISIAGALREQDRRLAEARQKEINSEYVGRLGALAAGAAHELGSPLSTMSVLVNELQHECRGHQGIMDSLTTISRQIDACKDTLSDLTSYSRDALVEDGELMPVGDFLRALVDKWQVMRPGARLRWNPAEIGYGPMIRAETSLGHAVLNLLNNAADASPDHVELRCDWDDAVLHIVIADRGGGISPQVQDKLFKPFYTTKGSRGSGIGLLLAKTAVERLGGMLRLYNRPDGGAYAEMLLPRADRGLPAEHRRDTIS